MENQQKSNVSKGRILAIAAVVLAIVFAVLCATHVICLKHDWQPATCTEPSVCAKCGRTQGEPAGHTEEADAAVAPTCTEAGLTAGSHCAVCGEVLVPQETVPAAGHTPVTDNATVPTCTESALTEGAHCAVCGEVLTAQEVIEALGHTEVIDEAVEPTCTETGLTQGSHCSVCGEVLVPQEVVDATGHTEEADAAVEPTCTETGLTAGSHCAVCGEVLVPQEVVPAVGHSFTEATYLEPEICTVCGATGADALGNSLFSRFLKGFAPERALSDAKKLDDLNIKFTVSLTGEGLEEADEILAGSKFGFRLDADGRAAALDAVINNGTPFSFIFSVDEDGTFRFAVPGADENVYKLTPEALFKIVEELSESSSATVSAGEAQQLPLDPDTLGRISEASTELFKKLLPHFSAVADIVNPDTVTDVPGEYALTALGETVSCRVLTCKPTKDDWKKVVQAVSTSISGDAELKQCVFTLMQPLVDAGLVPDLTDYYDYAMMALPLLGGQIAGYLEGAEFELAYEGDRIYSLRAAYNGTGFGFECAGKLETGLRGVLALYTDAEAHVLGRFDAVSTDNELKGSFVSEDIGLTGDLTCTVSAPDCFDVTLNAALDAYKFTLTENVNLTESFATAHGIVETPEFNEDVLYEMTFGPVEIALPAGSEIAIEDAETFMGTFEKIGEELYNAECLGHDWQEADCDTPRTCRICGLTEGEAAGHVPGEWAVTKEATTTEAGEESLLCSVCGKALETRETAVRSAETPDPALTGDWTLSYNWSGLLNEELIYTVTGEEASEELLKKMPSVSFLFILSLNGDGSFVYTADAEQFKTALTAYFEGAMPPIVTAALEKECADMGITLEDVLSLYGVADIDGLLEAVGIDDILADLCSDETLGAYMESATVSGTYAVSDDILTFDNGLSSFKEPFTLFGTELTLTGSPDGNSAFASAEDYPLVFTKNA